LGPGGALILWVWDNSLTKQWEYDYIHTSAMIG
jgi:hypothetical protein